MKTYLELEQIGIVGMYHNGGTLHVITKGGDVWYYVPQEKRFSLLYNLTGL